MPALDVALGLPEREYDEPSEAHRGGPCRGFLFTAACELDHLSDQEAPAVPEGSFLKEVVKPIYKVMATETFELHSGAPKFKFGKAPAPARACNYDDWNEPFGRHLWRR
eukprot:Skav228808  [mRNA]  locus=scaffold359:210276:213357:+ [translate_table: standard]